MKVVGFITQVLLVSLLISLAIKYGGPVLEIEPTALNALLGITVPPLIIAFLLIWQTGLGRKST
jgi:hypothetical protein